MIAAVGNSNNKYQNTGFGAIIPVKEVRLVNNAVGKTIDSKEIHSGLSNLVNILLKKDKSEFAIKNKKKMESTRPVNNSLRTLFKQKVGDYFIPYNFSSEARSTGDNFQKVRLLSDKKTGKSYILTGKDGKILDSAMFEIANANRIDNIEQRETALAIARNRCGRTIGALLKKVSDLDPQLILFGKKESSGKISPTRIEFSEPELVQGSFLNNIS